MKITKDGKELDKSQYRHIEPIIKELIKTEVNGCKINCFSDCVIDCNYNCEIDCHNNCKIVCGDNCKIDCGSDCKIVCGNDCEIRTSKGTEVIGRYNSKEYEYIFKEKATIIFKDGKFEKYKESDKKWQNQNQLKKKIFIK